ncbi:MAG: hypothetical protein Q7S28_02555, partial [bacterium]|nr:hypothetical protein [bacterium]
MNSKLYRFYEILPGAFAWATLIGMVFFSWKLPTAVSIFIILFDVYWLLKTVYLSFHLRTTFREMRKNMGIDWLAELGNLTQSANRLAPSAERPALPDWRDIYHIIVLPMYKEPEHLVRESLLSIMNAHYPHEKFIAVLATEEAGGEDARQTAREIEKEFGSAFHRFYVTTHPAGLPNEIPGKGSNETWAMKKVKAEI